MSRTRPWIPCFWLALALIVASGGVVAEPRVTLSELISEDTLKKSSGGDDLVHDFSQQPDEVRVSVRSRLKRGEFAWRVENSAGEVLWRESARAKSKIELTRTFPGQAGEWRIVLDYKEASGDYKIKMEAIMPGRPD